MRRFPIGSYPAKGVSEARSDARALHTRVKHDGADPIAQRRRERAIGEAAKAGIGTLAAVLDTYGEKRGNQQRAWPQSRKRINLSIWRTPPLACYNADPGGPANGRGQLRLP